MSYNNILACIRLNVSFSLNKALLLAGLQPIVFDGSSSENKYLQYQRTILILMLWYLVAWERDTICSQVMYNKQDILTYHMH